MKHISHLDFDSFLSSQEDFQISLKLMANICRNHIDLTQGPLKKWTEHSLELHLLKIHSRGAPSTPQGWMEVDFLDHELL